MKQARRPHKAQHRARPAAEGEKDMDSYRNQIIAMLDTITDAKLMRTLHDIIKTILMNR